MNQQIDDKCRQIGWIEYKEGFYPLYAHPKGAVTTTAFILCKQCQAIISSSGGPRSNAICMNCYSMGD